MPNTKIADHTKYWILITDAYFTRLIDDYLHKWKVDVDIRFNKAPTAKHSFSLEWNGANEG